MDLPFGWPGGDWQTTAKLIGFILGSYLFLIWVATILWAYRDIRGRTRDIASQAIGMSMILALPLVGVPIYLVARPRETLREAYDRQLEQEAILSELHSVPTCPQCRRPVDQDWAVCAFCSHELKQPCASCNRLLLNAWRHCPYCTAPRPHAAGMAGTPARASAEPATMEAATTSDDREAERPRRSRSAEAVPIPARPGAGAPEERPG